MLYSLWYSRWIRLLFGREFTLPTVLEVWDALFADGSSLVDYMCVAMLMHIREVCKLIVCTCIPACQGTCIYMYIYTPVHVHVHVCMCMYCTYASNFMVGKACVLSWGEGISWKDLMSSTSAGQTFPGIELLCMSRARAYFLSRICFYIPANQVVRPHFTGF